MTQKQIAQQLDIMTRVNGATSKQIWFLAGLIAKAGETVSDAFGNNWANMNLSKQEASLMINEYLKVTA